MTSYDPVKMLLSKLKGVEERGGNTFTALCPAHDDNTPSLSISRCDDGKALVHCHAGCSAEQICKAVGLSVANLYPDGDPDRRIVAEYDYVDEEGTLLFQTVRFDPKDFRQRRADGAGNWIWSIKGVRRVLYQLPRVIAAPPTETIFIVEGEKDVDNLIKIGVVATTCPMGAGKWKYVEDKVLEGRPVVIIADKDKSGRLHAADVAKRLHGRAISLRIIEVPGKGKDASDWLAAGGTHEELLRLVAKTPAYVASESGESKDEGDEDDAKASRSQTQASILVQLAEDMYLFFDGEDGYAAIELANGGRDVLPIRSKKFKRYLSRLFYVDQDKTVSSQALNDALTTIEGRALFEGPEHKVHVRIAEHDGAIYVDLADDKRQIVKITSGGWEIMQDAPVYFRHPKGLNALPVPLRGGSLQEFRQFINVDGENAFTLLMAWLVAAMRPNRPTPILALSSEQGSGKSTATRLLRMMIDPNLALIRSAPREPRDLMIAASNAQIIALDNLSHIQDWLSDALCRLSTGGGFSTRTLYENDEEQLFTALRPVILNGIEELGHRSDLLDRSLRVSFPTISEDKRQTEDHIYARFHEAHPRLLGALLTAVSIGLSRLPSVVLDRLPRMADFVKWVVACEPAMPWEAGDFLKAYWNNCETAHDLALENSLIAEPMMAFAEQHAPWSGKASELLACLDALVDDKLRTQKEWPKRPNVLSGILRRLAPNLRAKGVMVEFPDRTRKSRALIVRKGAQNCVTSVTHRHGVPSGSENGVPRDASCGERDAAVTQSGDAETPYVTQRDDGDAQEQPLSGCVETAQAIREREVAEL